MQFVIASDQAATPEGRRVEIVERKGLGHPDSICDAIAEEFSLELARFYLENEGRVLHHNVDKALLAAGRTTPRFGGGSVEEPIEIILAGRAATSAGRRETPIAELAERAARRWLEASLPALDPGHPPVIRSLVRPGSSELTGLFDERTDQPLANDTSCGVGYAPLSEVERLVLAVETSLTSAEARALLPSAGQDVKVMAVRVDDRIDLTVACAMIDRALSDLAGYRKATEAVEERVRKTAASITSCPVTVRVNAADDLSRGRVYLTVTGTSAEAGDDGQAGRGNRANGLITPGRAMTIESVAGKNPVTHVGKLYNVVASSIADRLVRSVGGVTDAACRLVSRIGHPIAEPQLAEVRLAGDVSTDDTALRDEVERLVVDELSRLPERTAELVRGDLKVDRWPMRT